MNVTAIQNSNNVISQKNTSPTFGMRIDIKPQDVEKVWSPEELKAFKRMFADVKTAKGKEIFVKGDVISKNLFKMKLSATDRINEIRNIIVSSDIDENTFYTVRYLGARFERILETALRSIKSSLDGMDEAVKIVKYGPSGD